MKNIKIKFQAIGDVYTYAVRDSYNEALAEVCEIEGASKEEALDMVRMVVLTGHTDEETGEFVVDDSEEV